MCCCSRGRGLAEVFAYELVTHAPMLSWTLTSSKPTHMCHMCMDANEPQTHAYANLDANESKSHAYADLDANEPETHVHMLTRVLPAFAGRVAA